MSNLGVNKWLITIVNPVQNGYTRDRIKEILSENIRGLTYWCMCDEITYDGIYHKHIFLYKRLGIIRFDDLKKAFLGAKLEPCNDTVETCRAYVRKEGVYRHRPEKNLKNTFEEYGICPKEGS